MESSGREWDLYWDCLVQIMIEPHPVSGLGELDRHLPPFAWTSTPSTFSFGMSITWSVGGERAVEEGSHVASEPVHRLAQPSGNDPVVVDLHQGV
jgi:hypothetical protein